MKTRPWQFALIGLLIAVGGCASGPKTPPLVLTGDIMVDGPNAIANGPHRDKVLWEYRTAAAAMRLGRYEIAKQYLDDALLTIGGIFGKDVSAKQARGYFHEEAKKNFIGEPYERVMAYYYRGIIYWMDGEPDNARACFRSAQLQDMGTKDEKFSADYAVLDYLDGFATVKLGGDGADAFQRATKESKLSSLPAYNREANVLFLVEFDRGPIKYATGEYGQELRFRVLTPRIHTAAINVEGQKLTVGAVDDLEFQATTRGGRVMDHVLDNKAVFKSATDVAGTAAIVGGAIAASSGDRTSQQVGIGLLAAGLITKAISGATTPRADTRSWDNLPRYLSFAQLTLPPGPHVATIEFMDGAGRPLPDLTKSITVNVPEDGKDKVVFVSDQSLTPQTI